MLILNATIYTAVAPEPFVGDVRVCNGKILMKDRELLGIDEEKVLYEVRNAAADLAKSING